MYKLFPAFENLIIIINFIMFVSTLPYECVHDEVSLQNIPVDHLSYRMKRSRRDINSSSFEPLNVHVHMANIDGRLSKDIIYNINFAVQKAIKYLSTTMKVKQNGKPFLLERTSCSQKWRQGVNQGKCSRMKSGPEFCSLKETDFVIPDQYLNKLEIYNNQASDPIYSTKIGTGLEDSNFILFVISKTTSWCQRNGIQAYGSYCRLNNMNRPVAGLLNLCPENFSKQLYKPDHYFNIVMHEMFHILGFSKHLYSKFTTCNSIYDCEVPKNIVNTDKYGIQRLIFPEVVKSMQVHFNCSDDEFGAPLENFANNSANKYSSHWHPLLLYSSIMTPSIQQDEYVVIDNITLALLASTGWYKMDFSKAQPFIFGQGEGCSFGDNCTNSKYLCVPGSSTGCDISYKTVGKCEKVTLEHSCGIYKPNKEEICVEEEGKLYGMDLESLEYERRCISLEQENTSLSLSSCVVLNCESSTSFKMFIDGSWINCEYGNPTKAQIGNITVSCPKDQSFCLTKGSEVSEEYCTPSASKYAISIQMYFDSPSLYNLAYPRDYKKQFETKTIEAIAGYIGIPANYIVNSSLHVFESVSLDFVICAPADMSQAELESLITKTQHFLENSIFTSIFKPYKDIPVAATKMNVHSEASITFSDYEGFYALIFVPVICAIFVLATFFASVMRHVSFQKNRPKRESIEIQELSGISLSS